MSFIRQPFDEFLGFDYERVDDRTVQVTLPIKPLYVNSVGVVHGGIISSLVDVAMSNLVDTEGGVQRAVTVDLHTTFLQGATGTKLVARARTVKQGRRMMYAECTVDDDKGQHVARAIGSFFMREK